MIKIACVAALMVATPVVACTVPANAQDWLAHNDVASQQIRDWDSLQDYYHTYVENMCQDGSVSEFYPEIVGRLFIADWDSLPRFVELSEMDSKFRAFVLAQLRSELYGLDDARATYRLARDHCPPGYEETCSNISKALLVLNPDGVKAD